MISNPAGSDDTLYLAGKASEWTKKGDVYSHKVGNKVVANVTALNFETVAYYDAAKTAVTHA